MPKGRSDMLASSVRQLPRTLAGDDARVDAGPVQPAEEPAVLDLHAAILHDIETGGPRGARRGFVLHTKLHPQAFRADLDGGFRERSDVVAPAKAVDQVYRTGDFCGGAQIGETSLAEDLRVFGIHRDHRVPVLEQVLADEVTRSMPLGGDADYRDAPAVVQKPPQSRNVSVV